MTTKLAEQIKHITPIEDLTYEIIERLSKENDFYIHAYEQRDCVSSLVKVTVDELKEKYEAYDQCVEEQLDYNNIEYFDTQPRDISEYYNKFCDHMTEKLKELQPHSMLHFDGADDTYDVYVVSKK